jgi:hypothetical protein
VTAGKLLAHTLVRDAHVINRLWKTTSQSQRWHPLETGYDGLYHALIENDWGFEAPRHSVSSASWQLFAWSFFLFFLELFFSNQRKPVEARGSPGFRVKPSVAG